MMPPITGIQASAAATFEGKPVDVDFGPSSGPGADGGGGGIGSWSGMTYIHRMQNGLSSKLAFAALFSLSLRVQAQYHALQIHYIHEKKFPSLCCTRLHLDRVAGGTRDHQYPGRDPCSGRQ